jgi:hypothetical protein
MRVGSSSLREFPLDVVRIECPSVAIEPEATAVTACWRGLRLGGRFGLEAQSSRE